LYCFEFVSVVLIVFVACGSKNIPRRKHCIVFNEENLEKWVMTLRGCLFGFLHFLFSCSSIHLNSIFFYNMEITEGIIMKFKKKKQIIQWHNIFIDRMTDGVINGIQTDCTLHTGIPTECVRQYILIIIGIVYLLPGIVHDVRYMRVCRRNVSIGIF
jgi:hypothetical protein